MDIKQVSGLVHVANVETNCLLKLLVQTIQRKKTCDRGLLK
jgi:hypothetical protein